MTFSRGLGGLLGMRRRAFCPGDFLETDWEQQNANLMLRKGVELGKLSTGSLTHGATVFGF